MNLVAKKKQTGKEGKRKEVRKKTRNGKGKKLKKKKNYANVHNLALEIKILLKEYIQQKDKSTTDWLCVSTV